MVIWKERAESLRAGFIDLDMFQLMEIILASINVDPD